MRPTIVVSDASFWAAVAPPSGVHRPSSWVSWMSWSRSLPPLSSIAISTPRFESSPRVESAPERTPQYAMWIGSPAGTVKTPSSSDGAAAPPALHALSARSAATPSAPTRMKRFKVSPPRDPIGPYTRPIMIECDLGPPMRVPGRTTGSPFESLDRDPLQDRAPGVLVLDGRPDPSPGGAQVAAEAMPYHMRRRTECNTVRPRPAPSSSCPLAGPGRRGLVG